MGSSRDDHVMRKRHACPRTGNSLSLNLRLRQVKCVSGNRAEFPASHCRLIPECFKTQVLHFPIQRNGRTGMQWATLGKSGSEAASQLQGRIARAFSSNILVNAMDMMAAI